MELEAAAAQAIADLPDVFEGDAHAFLSSIYKNTKLPLEIRILAAGRALRVEKPVLSAVQGRVDITFDFADRLGAARKRAEQARGLLEIDGTANHLTDS
ncbi:hypothetical protein [Devosia sp.]|uniref:hypothetical protein n=1 Tax=Devosia sp. TaxID=1871048 RepID=UPI003BAAC6E0